MRDVLNTAQLSPSTLSFDSWELEEAYRWYALSKFSITTGIALLTFAIFESLALLWNIGSVFGSDPSLEMLFQKDIFDLFWIVMHGVFFPIYMFTACSLMLRLRCIDVKGERAISVLLPEGNEEQCPSLYRTEARKSFCRRACCAMAIIPPNAWQCMISISSVCYVLCYTRLWASMGSENILMPAFFTDGQLVATAAPTPTPPPVASNSSSANAAAESCLTFYQKGSILGAAYGMTQVLIMAIASAVGGLRFPFVVAVQCLIVVDCTIESITRSGGPEFVSLWFWPVFKAHMAAIIFILYSRISETMSRTAFVQWLRLKNANIKAELKMNPFSTRSLTRWLRSPAKGSLDGSSMQRPLADSLLADDFANGVSRQASRASSETQRSRIGAFVADAMFGDATMVSTLGSQCKPKSSAAGAAFSSASSGAGAKGRDSVATEQVDYLGRWDIPWYTLDLESKAGSGGSGQVYAALYDGQAVAAKELYSQKMSGALEELSREVSILSRLGNHPNIVGMYGISKEPIRSHPRVFIVMEFVDGGDLQVALERWGAEGSSAEGADASGADAASAPTGSGVLVGAQDSFFATTVLKLAQQVAAGMRFIHANRVLHLDLKPGNILVAPCSSANVALRCSTSESERLRGARLKLTDFGLSSSSTLRKQQRVAQARARAKAKGLKGRSKGESAAGSRAGGGSEGATSAGSSRASSTSSSGGLEAYATVPGTPLYMAPELLTKARPRGVNESEVIEGFDVATKRDVYAFGILLAAIATRGSPYGRRADEGGADELTALLGEIAGDGSAACSGLRPDNVEGAEAWTARLPPALMRVMRACWAASPRDRPSFEEVCGLLADIAARE
jgi:serine/threonine protein kinase